MFGLFTACLVVFVALLEIIAALSPHSDLDYWFGEYNGIIADRNDVQNYENKTQVVINQNYP